ncbi:hypothetical protein B0H13DRAFT_1942661 [Mycena leptocephala]|nr:hypothetical protein B0H13DRAFT_1942661 [Mycena leptocephala]
MFSFYPRPQSYYQPSPYHPSAYYQPSAYARALAQQQQQQRARELAQEMERQRLARSRYFPNGYDYEPESDEEDYYLTPRQRALLDAKRRQEALEQRKQAAARVAHENALKEQARAAEKESVTHIPATQAGISSTPAVTVPEVLEEAATKIQTQYRIHRSLRAISELASRFESLKASFAGDGTIVSVPVPETPVPQAADGAKLAFTQTNVPCTRTPSSSAACCALDAVESRGDRKAEAGRVEAFWRGVWQQQGAEEEEVCAMVVDEEAAAVSTLPELAAPESESDVEPELPTPPATPAASPELVLSESEPVEDGVVVDMLAEEEKVPGDGFVLV